MGSSYRLKIAKSAVYAGLIGTSLALFTPAVTAHAEDAVTLQIEKTDEATSTQEALSNYKHKHGSSAFDEKVLRTVLISTHSKEDVKKLEDLFAAKNIKVLGSGTELYQGVWVEASFSDIEAAVSSAGSPMLSSISDSHTHATPTLLEKKTSGRKKRDLFSNELIETNISKYTGAGKLVAVIDTGFDIGSPDFQALSTDDKLRIGSAEELSSLKEKAGVTKGKFLSTKVPFIYNYADDTEDTTGNHLHGTHVSGILVGNPPAEYGVAQGVLPKAQLVAMKAARSSDGVFADYALVQALEDAVKLGVDVINCSWGVSAVDNSQYYNEAVFKAVEKAKEKGIIVSFAAGNEGTVGNNTPIYAKYVDYGVQLAPSSLPTNLTVASINNSKMYTRAITMGDVQVAAGEIVNKEKAEALFDKDLEAVAVPGVGRESDYQGLDVSGKVAVVARGDISFQEKATIAKKHGAALIIIVNYEGQAAFTMTLGTETELPAILMSYENGQKLREVGHLSISSGDVALSYPEALLMSNFSSWKTDANQPSLSPDITAPGGFIYSAVEDGKFALENGTSMAAPHVSAVAAIVKDHAKELLEAKKQATGAEYSAQDMWDLTSQLIMSYAVPQVVDNATQKGVLVSPRQQGAGLVNVERAMGGKLVLVGDANKSSKIASIDDAGTMHFSVTLRNYSDSAKTYSYKSFIQTDEVNSEGKITYKPYFEKETEVKTVTVEPYSDTQLDFAIDVSDTSVHPNTSGNFVDAYVRFESDSGDFSLSLPVSAFRGNFNAAPIFEESIYDLSEKGEEPLFLANSVDTLGVLHNNFTHLATAQTGDRGLENIVLGTVVTPNSETGSWDTVTYDKEHIAYSPNMDSRAETLRVNVTAFRTARDVQVSYYNESGELVAGPYAATEGLINGLSKKYVVPIGSNYDSGHVELRGARLEAGNQKLADGSYTMKITAVPNSAPEGTAAQELSLPFKVDSKAPVVGRASYDGASRTYTISGVSDTGSGVRKLELKSEATKVLPNVVVSSANDLTDKAISFTLPEGTSPSDFTVLATDYAENVAYVAADSLVTDEGAYSLSVAMPFMGNQAYPVTYSVYDSVGTLVDPANYKKLAAGTYTLKVDRSSVRAGYTIKGGLNKTFELSEAVPHAQLELELEKLPTRNVSAKLTRKSYYAKVKPELVNVETGERFALSATSEYATTLNAYRVPAGTYRIEDASLNEDVELTYAPNPLVLEPGTSTVNMELTYTKAPKDTTPKNNLWIKAAKDNEYTEPLTFVFTNADGKHSYEFTTTADDGSFSAAIRKNMAQGDYTISLKNVPDGYAASYPETYNLGDRFYYAFFYSLKKEAATPVSNKVQVKLEEGSLDTMDGVRMYLVSGDEKIEIFPGRNVEVDLGDATNKTYALVAENLPEGYSLDVHEVEVQADRIVVITPTFTKEEPEVVRHTAQVTLSPDALDEVPGVKLYLVAGDEKIELQTGVTLDVDLGDSASKTYTLVAENLPEGTSLSSDAELMLSDGQTLDLKPSFTKEEPVQERKSALVEVLLEDNSALSEDEFRSLRFTFVNAEGERFSEKEGDYYKLLLGHAPGANNMAVRAKTDAVSDGAAATEDFSVEVEGLPEGVSLADESKTLSVSADVVTSYTPHFVKAKTDVEKPDKKPDEEVPTDNGSTTKVDANDATKTKVDTTSQTDVENVEVKAEAKATRTKATGVKALLPKTSDPYVAVGAMGMFGVIATAVSRLIKRKH